jgi:hypothetical protein
MSESPTSVPPAENTTRKRKETATPIDYRPLLERIAVALESHAAYYQRYTQETDAKFLADPAKANDPTSAALAKLTQVAPASDVLADVAKVVEQASVQQKGTPDTQKGTEALLSDEDLKSLFLKVAADKGRETVLRILTGFGAEKLSEVAATDKLALQRKLQEA